MLFVGDGAVCATAGGHTGPPPTSAAYLLPRVLPPTRLLSNLVTTRRTE